MNLNYWKNKEVQVESDSYRINKEVLDGCKFLV